MDVKIYERKDGTSPFSTWFNRLDKASAVQVTVALARLEQGNTSRIKWNGSLGWLKINWGQGLRIYLGKEGSQIIVLFYGGTKKRQQADIEKAKNLLQEYRARKRAGEV